MQVAGGNARTDAQALEQAQQLRHGLVMDPRHPLAGTGFGDNRSPQTDLLIEEYTKGYLETAVGVAGGELLGGWFRAGREFLWFRTPGWIERIAPFGNRTGDPLGRFPHYHRRVPDPLKPGESLPGQGIGRHRPLETRPSDSSWWDRF